ncbi:D-2-hydroxyacid dehydrogenase family protein [Microvirga yunnanensis]|uniref:D-2-hydroxyacid dehydrogenase family protein n=1 Tax=Microvirga yunnanensis TaxID=2953740 RepID=UPI0021C9F667|nr:D-2-hydroxyacid dehydrogenase family protein [Microvirga sp. HBU65207]
MIKVAVLDDYCDTARGAANWSVLPERATLTVFNQPIAQSKAVEVLQPFDVLCTLRERMPLPGSLLRQLCNLKLIVTVGTDITNLDRSVASEMGITVISTSMQHPDADLAALMNSTPELTWGLMMAAMRHIAEEDRNIRQGGWQSTLGMPLAGRTLGLLGFGKVAKRMAHYGRAFDMNVIAWSPSLTPEAAHAAGARRVERNELFQEADILSIHVTLNDETRGFVGSDEFALMKHGSYLINTSRGPIIDENALLAALRAGTIAGAGLDVFDVEPLPVDHPLRGMPNVTLTPHLGYATRPMLEAMFHGMPAVIADFFAAGR